MYSKYSKNSEEKHYVFIHSSPPDRNHVHGGSSEDANLLETAI